MADLPRPKRGRRRIFVLVAIATALVIGLRWGTSHLDDWVRVQLAERLSRALSARVEFGEVRVRLVRLTIDWRDLTILASAPGGEQASLVVDAGSADLAWVDLPAMLAGRLRFRSLRLERPRFDSTQAFWKARRRADPPRPRTVALRVDRLRIEDGQSGFDDRDLPFTADLASLDLEGLWDAGRHELQGRFQASVAVTRPPLVQPLPLVVQTGFRATLDDLRLRGLVARGPGVELDGDATIGWYDGLRIAGRGEGRVALATLYPYLDPSFPEVSGDLEGLFSVEQGPEPFTLRGTFRALDARLDRMAIPRAWATATLSGGQLALSQLDLDALGGHATGELEVGWQEGSTGVAARLHATGVRSDELFDWLGASIPLAARVDGDIEIRGQPARRESWQGRVQFDARQDASLDGVAVSGAGEAELVPGRILVRAGRADFGNARLDARLDLPLDPSAGAGVLTLEGTTADARSTQAAMRAVLARLAIDLPDLVDRELTGVGDVRARIVLGKVPDLSFAIHLTEGSWNAHRFDRLVVDASLTGDRLVLRDFALRQAAERLAAHARVRLAPFSVEELHAEIEDLDPGWLDGIVDLSRIRGGRFSGRFDVSTTERGRSGGGTFTLLDTFLQGETADRVVGRWTLDDDRNRIDELEITGPALSLLGSVDWWVAGEIVDLHVERATVFLDQLSAARNRGMSVKGTVRGAGTLELGPTSIGGTLDLEGEGIELMGRAIPSMAGVARFTGLDVELSAASPAADWILEARVGLNEESRIQGALTLREFTTSLFPRERMQAVARLSGRVEFAGSAVESPNTWSVDGAIEELSLLVGTAAFSSRERVPLRWLDGAVALGPLRLTGEGSDLVIQLAYDAERDDLDASVNGTVALGTIAASWPSIRGSGSVQVDARVRGSTAAPQLSGSLRAEDARLRWLGYPQALERLSFDAELRGQEIELTQLRARLGNGEVLGSAHCRLEGLVPVDWGAQIELANVRADYPEGFRGIWEGRLALSPEGTGALLKGELRLIRGLYDRPVELGSLIGRVEREVGSADLLALPGTLFLDLDLDSEGSIRVRNDLARLEGGFDLHVGGTFQRPEVTGRLQALPGGRLTFLDNEYSVIEGTLDYTEIEPLDPYLTLEAETRVRDWNVFLRLEGRLDRLEHELRSDPPLSSPDILSLLATGSTRDELDDSGRTPDQWTGDWAAGYFASAVTGRLTRPVERRLGLERIRINPLLVEGEADPTTRVTVGKRVTDDVLVVFSSDFGEAQRHIYRVEWATTRKLLLSGERDTLGGVGGDIHFRDRFWLRDRPAAPTSEPPSRDLPAADAGALTIRAVEILPAEDPAVRRLIERAEVKPGAAFSRAAMLAGVEAVRSYYVEQGRLEATIDATSRPVGDGIDVSYVAIPGPRVRLEFEGVGRRERRELLERLGEIWVESVFSDDLYPDVADDVRRFYRGRGYYAVDVVVVQGESADGERRVRFVVDRGPLVRVQAIEFVGVKEVPIERIRRQVLTRSSTTLARRVLIPDQLDEDLSAVRNLYRDLGYLRVRVGEPRIRLTAAGDAATIEVAVDEGPRFVVAAIEWKGESPFDPKDLEEWSGLTPGMAYSPSGRWAMEDRLRSALDTQGYPDARVTSDVEFEGTNARLDVSIAAGAHSALGEIVIRGNRLTREKILRREIALAQGDTLTREGLQQAQRRLYRLGLFRRVELRREPMDDSGGAQRLVVEVEENPPLVTAIGLGYDTESGPRTSFSLFHENVGGYDRTLGVQGRLSGIERRVQFLVQEPRLFARRLPALLSFAWEEREEDDFSFERRSSAFRLDHRVGPKWSGFSRYGFQRVSPFDVEPEADLQAEKIEAVALGDLGLTFVRDTRDDPLQPTRGSLLSLGGRVFAEPLLSERSFVKLNVAASVTAGLPRATVFWSGARVGSIWRYDGTTAVPISEGFFAGGDSTLRGFSRDSVGPADGGEALILLNEEFRFPIWRGLRGVVFYDAGNVWEEVGDIDPTDLRHVLGAGLRIETPFGPLRVEYGRKLDRQAGESLGELFLSIGAMF